MSDPPVADTLSEPRASQVLDRAARLDVEGHNEISIYDLRKAALDAGIRGEAFDRALSEVLAEGPAIERRSSSDALPESATDPHARGSRAAAWLPRATVFGLGSALAGMSLVLYKGLDVDDSAAILFSLIISVFVVINLATKRRKDRAVADFEYDLAALWTGLTLVWMLAEPIGAMDVLAGMGVFGGLAGLLGGLLVRLRRRKAPAEDVLDGPEPELLRPAST